jgi:hypothetical protein
MSMERGWKSSLSICNMFSVVLVTVFRVRTSAGRGFHAPQLAREKNVEYILDRQDVMRNAFGGIVESRWLLECGRCLLPSMQP